MAVETREHETHVAGGKASHAPPTGWRATYGETARADRKALVEAARARLASEPAFSEESSTVGRGGPCTSAQREPTVDGSPVRTRRPR